MQPRTSWLWSFTFPPYTHYWKNHTSLGSGGDTKEVHSPMKDPQRPLGLWPHSPFLLPTQPTGPAVLTPDPKFLFLMEWILQACKNYTTQFLPAFPNTRRCLSQCMRSFCFNWGWARAAFNLLSISHPSSSLTFSTFPQS